MDVTEVADAQQGPVGPPDTRFADWKAAHEPLGDAAVRVTAADFNGTDWDGCPFSAMPEWLRCGLRQGAVKVSHTSGGTDYAVWDVSTPLGLVRALPGDYIVHADGVLAVDEYLENYRHPARLPPLVAGLRYEDVLPYTAIDMSEGIKRDGPFHAAWVFLRRVFS